MVFMLLAVVRVQGRCVAQHLRPLIIQHHAQGYISKTEAEMTLQALRTLIYLLSPSKI